MNARLLFPLFVYAFATILALIAGNMALSLLGPVGDALRLAVLR